MVRLLPGLSWSSPHNTFSCEKSPQQYSSNPFLFVQLGGNQFLVLATENPSDENLYPSFFFLPAPSSTCYQNIEQPKLSEELHSSRLFLQSWRVREHSIPHCVCVCVCALCRVQLFATPWTALPHPTPAPYPGSSVHAVSQARILEWVAISFSKGPLNHLGSPH